MDVDGVFRSSIGIEWLFIGSSGSRVHRDLRHLTFSVASWDRNCGCFIIITRSSNALVAQNVLNNSEYSLEYAHYLKYTSYNKLLTDHMFSNP